AHEARLGHARLGIRGPASALREVLRRGAVHRPYARLSRIRLQRGHGPGRWHPRSGQGRDLRRRQAVDPTGGRSTMKVFALSKRKEGASLDKFHALQKAETQKVWELYVANIVREIYFRSDRPGGVLVLECADAEEAKRHLGELPMAKA